jgi:hypothetical protein
VYVISGSRFQAARNTGKEKDVATKHEDQADCPWHNRGAHSDHHPVGVPWIQVQVRAARSSNTFNCHYITLLLLLRAKTIWCFVLSFLSVLWPGSWCLRVVFTLSCLGGCLLNAGWWLGQRVVYFWTLCMYSLDLDTFVLLYE